MRALDEILQVRPVGADRLDRSVEPELRAALCLLGLARGGALLGHVLADDLARERRRVGVADDDQDARQPAARIGLGAGDDDALDRAERAIVAHPQRLGVPRVGVARAQLAEQRGELPAERERDRHDDELQRAHRAVRRRRPERLVQTLTAQHPLERVTLLRIGRREDIGDRLPGEPLRRSTEQRDDADAALRDDAVRGAEDVAAIGKPQQHLLDVVIGGHGRGHRPALKAHDPPIGPWTPRG